MHEHRPSSLSEYTDTANAFCMFVCMHVLIVTLCFRVCYLLFSIKWKNRIYAHILSFSLILSFSRSLVITDINKCIFYKTMYTLHSHTFKPPTTTLARTLVTPKYKIIADIFFRFFSFYFFSLPSKRDSGLSFREYIARPARSPTTIALLFEER